MNIRDVSVGRLKEYENNPRNNDLAVEKVKYSIERFGFLFPVVIDVNYTIVAGHTRVRACKELGIQSVPCIIADELTEEQINLFRLVDNKTSEYSDWNFEKLKEELASIDLTFDANQLLLERFELSAEVFDIDAEQAEIRIPTLNFMGDADKSPNQIKVRTDILREETPHKEENSLVEESINTDVYERNQARESETNTISKEKNGVEINQDITNVEEVKSIRKPELIQFRFGEIQFYISNIELNRLNEKYLEYIDGEAALNKSFVDFLLEGVNIGD